MTWARTCRRSPGRSSAVSTDVADVVHGLMPRLMEIFCASDEVVEFEPVGPEDVEAAQQETDYVNHVFMQKNAGFQVLYDFIFDALLQKNGIAKVFWETSEREQRESYFDLDDDTLALLLADPEIEIVEHTVREREVRRGDPCGRLPNPCDRPSRAVRTAGDHEGRPYEHATQSGESMSFPTATPPDVQLAGPARVAPSHEAIAPLAAPAPVPPPPLAALAGLEPAAPPARRHDVTVVKRAKYGCARVMAVPPEEFGIARRARTLAEADYCFHAVRKAEHQLIAEGFDPEQVKALPSEGADDDPEAAARSSVDESAEASEGLNRSARMIEITEHYIRLDYEGDGRARLYRVVTGGGPDGEILRCRRSPDERVARIERQRNPGSPVPDFASLHPGYDDSDDDGETFKAAIEEVDVMPFAAMTPFPVPHRFTGRSAADQVVDIQKIKTALLRTLLDNAYASNMPRPIVSENGAGDNTLDDLLTWRHGAPIRVRGPIADAITWTQVPPIGAQLYPLMEYLDATREWRTGVTRQGQGIDANALANQSATAVNQMFTAAQGRMKLIARIFAETGIRDLFALLHHVIRKHDGRENIVRLRNRWVTVSPREWRTRENMTINVGLGTGASSSRRQLPADRERSGEGRVAAAARHGGARTHLQVGQGAVQAGGLQERRPVLCRSGRNAAVTGGAQSEARGDARAHRPRAAAGGKRACARAAQGRSRRGSRRAQA